MPPRTRRHIENALPARCDTLNYTKSIFLERICNLEKLHLYQGYIVQKYGKKP